MGDHGAQPAGTEVFGDHDATGLGSQPRQIQATPTNAEAIAALTQSDEAVDHPFRVHRTRKPSRGSVHERHCPHLGRQVRKAAGEFVEHLPLGAALTHGRDDRVRGLFEGCGVERLEHQHVIGTFVHARSREDEVGVGIGLVAVEVEGHAEIRLPERIGEFGAIGYRQHGIARAEEQRPQLSGPGCGDLLGHQ